MPGLDPGIHERKPDMKCPVLGHNLDLARLDARIKSAHDAWLVWGAKRSLEKFCVSGTRIFRRSGCRIAVRKCDKANS
jgi:hypothetical protein